MVRAAHALIRTLGLAVWRTVWSDVVPAEIRGRGWLVLRPGWFVDPSILAILRGG